MTMMITSVQWRAFPATEMILFGQDDRSSSSSDSDSGQDDDDIDERNEGEDKGEAEFEGDLGDVGMGDEHQILLPDDDIDIDISLPGRRRARR